jgi:hypothetical protein
MPERVLLDVERVQFMGIVAVATHNLQIKSTMNTRNRSANASMMGPPPPPPAPHSTVFSRGLEAALERDSNLAEAIAPNPAVYAENLDMDETYEVVGKENIHPNINEVEELHLTQETIGLTQEAMEGLIRLATLDLPDPYTAFTGSPSVQSIESDDMELSMINGAYQNHYQSQPPTHRSLPHPYRHVHCRLSV